jgi:hypothetical protein
MHSLLLLTLLAAPPSLDEVLQKNFAARGGLDRLRALKTLRIRSHNDGGWTRFETTTTIARGSRQRTDTSSQGMTESRAVDGKTGWFTNAFGGRKDPVTLSPDELTLALDEAELEGPLVDWKQKGHRLELLGSEDVDGSPAYKLKLARKSGTVEFIYLDADAFLEVKTVTQRRLRGALVETEAEFGNYQQVDGLFFPFGLEFRERRSQNTSRVTVDAVEVNVPVSDALFARPGARP